MKTVSDIMTDYLKANGFDGLVGDDCGCQLGDLFPCDCCSRNCLPARKFTWETMTEGQRENCEPDCEWYMIAD